MLEDGGLRIAIFNPRSSILDPKAAVAFIRGALVSCQVVEAAEELLKPFERRPRQSRLDNARDVFFQVSRIARACQNHIDTWIMAAKAIGRFRQRRCIGFFQEESEGFI